MTCLEQKGAIGAEMELKVLEKCGICRRYPKLSDSILNLATRPQDFDILKIAMNRKVFAFSYTLGIASRQDLKSEKTL